MAAVLHGLVLGGSGGSSSSGGGCRLLAWWLEARSRACAVHHYYWGRQYLDSAHTREDEDLGDAASLGSQSLPGTPHNRGHTACENVL
jgi:hypothetical protein